MSDWCVFRMAIAGGDGAHHHLTGVYSDASLKRQLSLHPKPIGVALKLILYAQSRIQRALRMVFVRDRRAEQREDTIAGGLHDVAVVAMDRVDHQLQRGIDNGARLLGVEVLHQLHRALDVGK
jgi:hypothetical protein